MAGDGDTLSDLLAKERRARLAAERLLEQKSRELFSANKKLSAHSKVLSEEIITKRQEAKTYQSEAETLRGENTQVRADLQKANQQAVKAERRLWEALETIHDGFAVYNTKRQLVIANRAYMGMFDGLDSIRPGATYADILALLSEEGLVDIGYETPEAWQARMLARWEAQVIEPVTLKLWDERYIRLIDKRARDGDLVCLGLDITDTIRYEEQLKEERRNAEAANRAKSAFLANMSHEIRTPMNGVVGMAELLCDTDLSEEQRLYADTIRSSGETLLVIINDVLDYSKIEAEKLTLHPEPTDLERVIHEVMLLLKPSAGKKGLDLMVDFDMFLPTRFVADPGRLRQILTNLVGNAVKFTESGHVLVRVTGIGEHTAEAHQDIHITVEDTGIGISKEMADHIFGEFNQVEDERNRKFEGTGLGLAITRRLVELMGGEMWVDSEVGEGSCFGFRLTLPTAEDATVPAAVTTTTYMTSALVIDDQQINRMILERQLNMMGISVCVRRSAEEALAEAVGAFDVIVTDYQMPDMDGVALTAALRARGEDAPILLLSSAPAEIGPAATAAGVTSVLQKPLLRRDLFERIGALGLAVEADGDTPEAEAAPEPAPADPQKPAPVTDAPADRSLRILAAEDNKTNQLVFKQMIKSLEADLTFANNGVEAVAAYEAAPPDIVFMDISMPEMDGKEATRRIREIERREGWPRVPICALTAHAMTGDDREILASGIDFYLTKPLKKDKILAMVHDNARASETTSPDSAG